MWLPFSFVWKRAGRQGSRLLRTGLCLLSLSVCFSPLFPLNVLADITPDRDVILSGTGAVVPEWKVLWDRARDYTRREHYVEAAREYARLLILKENLEEANWEYARVLIALKDWQKAAGLLEDLMEADPLRLEYLLSAGFVAGHRKEYASASTYYELVYRQISDKAAPQRIEALKGLVAALQMQGKDESAFPLMEELHQYAATPELLEQMAVTASRLGRKEKALLYYDKLVSQKQVEPKILLAAAGLFEEAGQEQKAFLCWEKYVLRYPDYLPFQEKMADFFLKRGKKEEALPHLLLLAGQGQHSEERLLQIGSIYLFDMQRPDKALAYYEQYARLHPQNQVVSQEIARVQAVLAREMASRVDQAGALPVWKALAEITPNRLAIYESMAEILEQRGNSQQLRDVLVILHQQTPENNEVVFRLVELFIEEKDVAQAEYFLGLLPPAASNDFRLLLSQGRLAELRGKQMVALDWYTRYLEKNPQDRVVRLRTKDLAARLGLIEQYEEQWHWLRRDTHPEELLRFELEHAQVLLACGLTARSREAANALLQNGAARDDVKLAACFLLADAYAVEGRYFEAEQALRQMLVSGNTGVGMLGRLVDLSLKVQDLELASNWLALLIEEAAALPQGGLCENDPMSSKLLEARWLAASGKTGKAIDLALEYLGFLRKHCPSSQGLDREITVILAQLHGQDQQYEQGREILAPLVAAQPPDLESLVLDRQLALGGDPERQGVNRVLVAVRDDFRLEFGALLDAARMSAQFGQLTAAREYVEMAVNEVPQSLSARVEYVRILRQQGDLEAASNLLQTLIAERPDEESFAAALLEVQFQQAEYGQIIARLIPGHVHGVGISPTSFPDTTHLSVLERMILARSLWADRQWIAAIAVYDGLLQPSVEMLFANRLDAEHTVLELPPPKKNLWHILTFTQPPEPERLAAVMEPSFMLRQRAQVASRIGAELYPAYRWQQTVATELSARRSLAQGDYFQAMKEYQDVVEKNPSPESLFDLAGIYSRLGLLGKEAMLYEQIEETNPDYPELATSVERNNLKRRTRTSLDSGYSVLSGRDGYYDIEQVGGGASVWVLPSLRQEVEVSWKTVHAMSKETDHDIWRNRLLGTYSFFPDTHLDVITQVGMERPDGDRDSSGYSTTPLYHVEARGRIGDDLHGFVSLEQDLVDDTVEALEQGITRRDLEGGVQIDVLPRLFGGGEYLFREYSDANHQNSYRMWGTYVLHTEPLLLQLTYSQELSHNDDGNRGRDYSYASGFAPGDHPYWSPKEYWQNQIAVHFKHQLAADVLGRSTPSYYTLDYALGYEDGGYDNHALGGDIFLEMSRHFLVRSSFDLIQGGPVIRKDVALSLVYRW